MPRVAAMSSRSAQGFARKISCCTPAFPFKVRAANATIVDGGATQSVVRALTADIGASTMVSGLTLRNGRATSGGGVQVRQGAPTFKNLVIENNEAWQDQGGSMVLDGGRVTLTNVVVRNNHTVPRRRRRGGGDQFAVDGGERQMSANSASVSAGGALAGLRGTFSLVNTALENNVSTSRRPGG